MSADPVLVEHRPGYQLITLNRPERLNAFNAAQVKAGRLLAGDGG